MDSLPAEVIAHIGRFLGMKDRMNAHNASHAFDSLSFEFTRHTLEFTADNYIERLRNIDSIMEHLKRVKPSLTSVTLNLINLPVGAHENVESVLQTFDEVRFIDCCDLYMIHRFPCVKRLAMQLKADTYYPYKLFDTLRDDVIITDLLIHERHLPLLYHACMNNVKRLSISIESCALVDLSRINNIPQIDLHVDITTFIVRVTDAHKVTHLSVYDGNLMPNWLEPLISSFTRDQRASESRLQKVKISNYYKSKHINEWHEFAKIMPKDVDYLIGPVKNPNIIPFMRKMNMVGAKNLTMYVNNDSTYRQARIIQLLEKRYGIKNITGFEPSKTYDSVHAIYEDMTDEERFAWYWLPWSQSLNGGVPPTPHD